MSYPIVNDVNAKQTELPELIQMLIRCRAERDLTMAQVAKSLKMSQGAISNLETGKAKLRRTTAIRIETFLRKQGYFAKSEAA